MQDSAVRPGMDRKRMSQRHASSLVRLQADASRELTENILPFTMQHVADWEHGGFYGYVANDRTAQKDAPKAIVQHSRILWTFSRAYRVLGSAAYLPVIARARNALADWFWDREHGGYSWMVSCQGMPLQADKFAFGQAYAIYGLAEDYLATGNTESLGRALQTFRLLEEHGRDLECGGYWEARHRDWAPAPELRVDETDLPVVKGMNSHLHLLEAYANLLHASGDDRVRASLRSVIDIMSAGILDAGTHHLSLFFDRNWHSLSDTISYGHDIEASWLLVEAAEALGEPGQVAKAREAALGIANATLELGVDTDGSLFYAGNPAGVTEREKIWWPQAEAVVGFMNAYQLNRDPRFLQAVLDCWRFIQERLVDIKHGDWFWGVDGTGRPLDRQKAGPWKTPYHNGRACLEVMRRVQELAGTA